MLSNRITAAKTKLPRSSISYNDLHLKSKAPVHVTTTIHTSDLQHTHCRNWEHGCNYWTCRLGFNFHLSKGVTKMKM